MIVFALALVFPKLGSPAFDVYIGPCRHPKSAAFRADLRGSVHEGRVFWDMGPGLEQDECCSHQGRC